MTRFQDENKVLISRRAFLFGSAAVVIAPALPDIVPKLVSEPQWTFEPIPPGIYNAEVISTDIESSPGVLAMNFKLIDTGQIVKQIIRLPKLPPIDWKDEE